MKGGILTFILHSLCGLFMQAATLPFERDGEPFYSSKFEVVWAATNQLPKTVRIFRVVPSNFSRSAVSYLESIGGFVAPKQGAMNFYKPGDVGMLLTNVPDKTRAYELGTNVLAIFGVPFSELENDNGRVRARFSPGTRGRFDRITRQHITEPHTMGVSFRRTVDGLRCNDQQVRLQYESRESLTQLEVRWHGLQPTKECVVLSSDQIISWIKEGHARAHAVETTGSRWIKVADIRKVTIRDIVICYNAAPDWRNDDKLPEHLYPYANIQSEVEFSSDDRETVWFSTPVIKEALSRPIRKDSEFNIYPSSFHEKQTREKGGA